MNQKSFEELRSKFEYLTDEELRVIWIENNLDEYSQKELDAVKQLLLVRNITIPAQKVFEESEDGIYSQEVVNSLLKGAMIFLLIFGVVNLLYWLFGGAAERTGLLEKYKNVTPLLWLTVYGEVVVCCMLIFMSALCFLQKDNIKILLFSGMLMVFSGLYNLFSNLLIIPALAQYGITVPFSKAYDDFRYFPFVLGVLQLRWGYNQLKDYIKVKRFESENNPKREYGNTPN